MGKFNKSGSREMPELNTSSLPDLIFSILFFFMMTTSMREVELRVEFKAPKATELVKLEDKSLTTYIYVGEPTDTYKGKFGTESQIQLNDKFAAVDEILTYVNRKRESLAEEDRNKLTTALKIDAETKMGIVSDVKQALRQAQALKIMYTATQEVAAK